MSGAQAPLQVPCVSGLAYGTSFLLADVIYPRPRPLPGGHSQPWTPGTQVGRWSGRSPFGRSQWPLGHSRDQGLELGIQVPHHCLVTAGSPEPRTVPGRLKMC